MISSIAGLKEEGFGCATSCVLYTQSKIIAAIRGNRDFMLAPQNTHGERGKVVDCQLCKPIPTPVLTGSGSKGLFQ